MVSPSKKQKLKSRDKVAQSSKKIPTGGNQQNHNRKPLCNKKFYLDIKNHVLSSKLETNLKSLGATVELFLVKEVNIVVTDRPQWTGGTSGSRSGSTPKCALPSPSPSFHTPTGACSASPATLDSPVEGLGRRRTKSRAEAMLERARLQPQQTTIDPLDNAARWSIPIWPVEKIWKWLEKVYEKSKLKGSGIHAGANNTSPKGKKLTAPYIKIDSLHGVYRPVYKEITVWPTVNLDFESIGSPFAPHTALKKEDRNKTEQGKGNEKDATSKSGKNKSPADSRMTRKGRARVRSEERGSALLSGYCEICQLNYTDRKKHLQTDAHIQFVNNDRNFLTLDTLIKQGSNMETFLKMNGASEISQCTLLSSTRRSLRSVMRLHTVDGSSPPSNTNIGSWKRLLSPTRKVPVSSISNGHQSTKSKQGSDEKPAPKVLDQKDIFECNGISSPHCYGTRYGGRNIGERVLSNRRNSNWDEHPNARSRPQRTRTASATYCTTVEEDQLSPTGSDSSHHLRSRSQLFLPANLLGTTAEDEANPAHSCHTEICDSVSQHQSTKIGHLQLTKICESQSLKNLQETKDNVVDHVDNHIQETVPDKHQSKSIEDIKSHGNNQVTKKKRLTAEEKLIEDNKAYYKLEVKNSKLRSSGHYLSQRETSMINATAKDVSKPADSPGVKETLSCNGEQMKPSDIQKPDIPLKEESSNKCRGKIRLSELSLLNNEAENFMFGEPVRKDITDESSEDEFNDNIKRNASDEKQRAIVTDCTHLIDCVKNTNTSEDHSAKKEDSKGKEVSTNITTTTHLQDDKCSQTPILQCDESSMGSIDSCSLASSCDTNTTPHRRRKRQTQAEAFIHDNINYYKFETPGSRLRFQGSMLPQTFSNKDTTVSDCKSKENVNKLREASTTESSCSRTEMKASKCKDLVAEMPKSNKNKESIRTEPICLRTDASRNGKIKESLRTETCPKTDTLKDKFDTSLSKENQSVKGCSMQDTVEKPVKAISEEEIKEKNSQEQNVTEVVKKDSKVAYESSAVEGLQFSFEAVPHSEPWYQTYQRQDEGEEFYLACLSDSGYWKPFLLPYEMPPSELLNSSAGPSGVGNQNKIVNSNVVGRKKRKRNMLLLDKKPRKSPRCHASTLAILSSLMHHRKRKEPDKTRDDDALKSIPEEEDDPSQDESMVSYDKTVANLDFMSESNLDMKEVAQNIDKMLTNCSEEDPTGSLPIVSSKQIQKDVSVGKPLKQKHSKFRKTHKHHVIDTKITQKKNELDCLKETAVLDVDPVILQELASNAAHPLECVPKPAVRCRGGPCMDVITLLDGFSECHCVDEVSVAGKESTNFEKEIHPAPINELSCNSSECGASSTCETVAYSDVAEITIKVPGRKRKRRKKNLTGWPADKQRLKKKVPKKVDKCDENLPKNRESEDKCSALVEKLHVLIEDNGSVEISTRKECSNAGNKESGSDKCSKFSNIEGILEKGEKISSDVVVHDKVGGELCKSISVSGNCSKERMTSRDDVMKFSSVHEVNMVDRHSSVDESMYNVCSTAELYKTGKHVSVSRTVSLDSNTTDLQPCIRVKKMENISDFHYLSSSSLSSGSPGITNNRRLRSASSSSSFPSSSPIRKRYCSDAEVKVNISPIRASARKKTLGGKWDSWSTRKRR